MKTKEEITEKLDKLYEHYVHFVKAGMLKQAEEMNQRMALLEWVIEKKAGKDAN